MKLIKSTDCLSRAEIILQSIDYREDFVASSTHASNCSSVTPSLTRASPCDAVFSWEGEAFDEQRNRGIFMLFSFRLEAKQIKVKLLI